MTYAFLLLTAGLVASTLAAKDIMFSANAKVEITNGYYEAKIYYRYDGSGAQKHYLRYEYTNPMEMIDLIDYSEGTRYKVCKKCESGYYTFGAPTLFKQAKDNATGAVDGECKQYVPADTYGLNYIWYKNDGTICKAELTDGKTLVLSKINTTFSDLSKFNISTISKCPAPVCKRVMDLVFVIDNSGSVGSSNWNKIIKPFVLNLIDLFDIGNDATLVGLLTYGNSDRTVFKLNADKAYMNRTLTGSKFQNEGTCTGCGVNAGIELLKDPSTHRKNLDPEKIMIVITDSENWNYAGNPCADYEPECTKRSTTECIKRKCSIPMTRVNTSICKRYKKGTASALNAQSAKVITGIRTSASTRFAQNMAQHALNVTRPIAHLRIRVAV